MINTVIFDLGMVLIQWDPRHLYRKIFTEETEMEHFLQHVCTSEWNEQQDAGRSWAEAIAELTPQFPQYRDEIAAFWGRWEEMLNGPIAGSVDILKTLQQQNQHRLYALTNWSAETFPIAQAQFDFLQIFEGILVSGEEKLKKPDPKIYQLLLDRYQIVAEQSVFIDDSLRNVKAAQRLGINAIHFSSPQQLREALANYGIEV